MNIETWDEWIRRHEWHLVAGAILLFVVTYGFFYPPISGIEDEYGFINNAWLWMQGKLYLTPEQFQAVPVEDFGRYGDKYLSLRNPGRSVLTMPFLALGTSTLFLSSLLIHISLGLVFIWILHRKSISPLYVFLILFHPTFSIYSRTIMGDAMSGIFLLLGWFFFQRLEKNDGWKSGIFLGLAAFTRYQAGLAVVLLLPFLCSKRGEKRKEALKLVVAAGIFGLGLLVYNKFLYGLWLGPTGGKGAFGMFYFPQNMAYYLPTLLVLWPGMLLAPWFERKNVSAGTLLCLGFLIFFGLYYFYDKRPSVVETMVVGQRLLQVILPVWIFIYVSWLHRKLNFKGISIALLLGMLVAGIGNMGLHWKHQRYLNGLSLQKDEVLSKIPAGSIVVTNTTLQKLFGLAPEGTGHYKWQLMWHNKQVVVKPEEADEWSLPWYIALSKKSNNFFPDMLKTWQDRYDLERVETSHQDLIIFVRR